MFIIISRTLYTLNGNCFQFVLNVWFHRFHLEGKLKFSIGYWYSLYAHRSIISNIRNKNIVEYHSMWLNHILEFRTCFSDVQIHFLKNNNKHDVLLSCYAPHVHYYIWGIVSPHHFSTNFQHSNRSEIMDLNCEPNTSYS